jgi:hypothetical protein
MKLPNGANAIVDIEKIRDDCLPPQHSEGRHKARVFLSALGMMAADANALRNILLLAALMNNDVLLSSSDQ